MEKTHEKRQLTGEAKQALEHGNILEAIQLLLENFPENLEIIQIQRRFSEQALLLRKGGTTEEQGMLERNRINDALLEIIRNLQDDPI